MKTPRSRCSWLSRWFGMAGILALAVSSGVPAEPNVTAPEVEGSFHGFPVLRDAQGQKLADGEFLQWIEDGRLRIRNTYDYGGGHRIEESVACRLEPFAQEEWSWREMLGEVVKREYAVDLVTGEAHAQKQEHGETRRWDEHLKIAPGRTFAGVGFTVALRHLRDELVRGEAIELKAVGFSPKPRIVTVKVSYGGIDAMLMSGRQLRGDRFVIDPQIPAVAKLLVKISPTRIWLTRPWPAGFLRWEGALAEPDEPIVRVDVLPGEPSGPAESAAGIAR